MKLSNKILPIAFVLSTIITVVGCDKSKPYETLAAESQVHFVGDETQIYSVVEPNSTYNVVIGTTDVSTEDRVVTFKVESPSGATVGNEYTLGVPGTTVTIPKGQTTVSIPVKGNETKFENEELDTLIITLLEPSIPVADFSNKVTLVLRGACLESDVSFPDMLGAYTKTYENGSYGPYTSTITSLQPVSATSAKAVITNIYDSGISAIATFDFSTPGAFKVTIDPQQVATLSGAPLYLKTVGTASKFTYCTPTLTLDLELYQDSGTYDSWQMTMAR